MTMQSSKSKVLQAELGLCPRERCPLTRGFPDPKNLGGATCGQKVDAGRESDRAVCLKRREAIGQRGFDCGSVFRRTVEVVDHATGGSDTNAKAGHRRCAAGVIEENNDFAPANVDEATCLEAGLGEVDIGET